MTFQDLCRTLPEDVVYLIRDFAVVPHPVGQLFTQHKEWILEYDYMRGREPTQTERTEANINEKWEEFMENIFMSYTYALAGTATLIGEWLASPHARFTHFDCGSIHHVNRLLKERNKYIMRWKPEHPPSPLMIRLSICDLDYYNSDAIALYPNDFGPDSLQAHISSQSDDDY